MKIAIDAINSAAIRAEMKRDSYKTAELLGTYSHPKHPDSNDWRVTLYYAADSYVFETNGDPVWDNNPDFKAMLAEYAITELPAHS